MNIRQSRLSLAVLLLLFPMALLMAFVAVRACAQESRKATLTVEVTGLRNSKGNVEVALFNNPAVFPNGPTGIVRQGRAVYDQSSKTARITFRDLPYGTYAIAVRHDENANGKLDTNLLGIPKEGYGFSNNPPAKLRPSTFDEAHFILSSPEVIQSVAVHYH